MSPRVYVRIPAVERVERRCVYEDRGYETPCRIFKGYIHEYGYGIVGVSGARPRMARVHRVTYEHYIGPIPEGLDIDHLCRQRDCCEVTHLEAVTRRENLMRGIGPELTRQRARAITHCPHGHEYSAENTGFYRTSNGYEGRSCLTCFPGKGSRRAA